MQISVRFIKIAGNAKRQTLLERVKGKAGKTFCQIAKLNVNTRKNSRRRRADRLTEQLTDKQADRRAGGQAERRANKRQARAHACPGPLNLFMTIDKLEG